MNHTDGLPNLVLGCGTNYSVDRILPFAATLRESSFSGEAALILYEDQGGSLSSLVKEYSITLIRIPRTPPWLPSFIGRRMQNRGSMRHVHKAFSELLRRCCNDGQSLSFSSQIVHYFYHISCGRYFLYFRYLLHHKARFSRVLLSDVRDVIFQSDPFYYAASDGLYFFMDPTVRLGDEPLNVFWIKNLFAEDYCHSRRGRRISCSGTTLGDSLSVLTYLQKMCYLLIQNLPRAVGQIGDDQAAHNFLLWETQIPNTIICENGENAVMTLKNAAAESFVLDEGGKLLNLDGRPVPVLHQYDFHPILKPKRRFTMSLRG
jgi:hypothetical protein